MVVVAPYGGDLRTVPHLHAYRGVTMILMRHFDAKRSWDLFIDERATTTLAVPAMLNMMLPTYDPALDESLQLR